MALKQRVPPLMLRKALCARIMNGDAKFEADKEAQRRALEAKKGLQVVEKPEDEPEACFCPEIQVISCLERCLDDRNGLKNDETDGKKRS